MKKDKTFGTADEQADSGARVRISDIQTEEPEVTSPDTTLTEAAKRMRELDVGMLPVCDGDRLVGILTDRDITIRATAEGRDPKKTAVRDVMTPKVVYCFDDQDVSEAARIMKEKQIRRLPVINREKRLVGVLSLGDLAVRTGDEPMAGDVLEGVSESAATESR
jgi:CBS domain-containing protein